MKALLSCTHVQHRTITDHDIIILTDFAAKVKYENASSSTCEKPNQGTMCIAVVLHSPARRPVKKDTTDTTQLSTGLEAMPISDKSKAPKTVQLGKRTTEVVWQTELLCDVFAGYSEESGHARFDQTLMRDITAYYKLGHLVYATAATHRGEPIPIGKDAASAKPSEYDLQRLGRLKSFHAAKEVEKKAEELLRQQSEAAAASSAAAPASSAGEEKGSVKVLKKRKSAGGKAKATADGAEG
eukprot:2146468-Prymnesium_polylepis.1